MISKYGPGWAARGVESGADALAWAALGASLFALAVGRTGAALALVMVSLVAFFLAIGANQVATRREQAVWRARPALVRREVAASTVEESAS